MYFCLMNILQQITDAIKAGADIGKLIRSLITTKADREKFEAEIRQADDAIRNQIQIELIKMDLAEMQSARDRELKINESSSAGWLAKNTSSILALSFFLLTAGSDLYCIMHGVPDSTLATTVISSLNNITLIIVGYYFGSSQGSKHKQDILDRK